MGKPYVYKIENKNGEFYFGVRWDYQGLPNDDLWINYFTSSSLIKEILINKGVEYFTPTIIKIFETREESLEFEYSLIKKNMNKNGCLNRALGKCTIWDESLKKQVSNSMKKLWENENYRKNHYSKSSGINHHNYNLQPWRNVNSDIKSWIKIKVIYDDFSSEKWEINKYGYGRNFLMRRYDIVQGTARKFISILKNNWNPYLDVDYLLFLHENASVS